ncbi:MAG: pentapeptide repeat-containing protein, partial [Deltaproteobacteria bacterium]
MRAKQGQHLFGAALRLAAAALVEHLWLPDQARLNALLELSTAPEISLADCLKALFPEKTRESALAELRNFRKRFNDLASEMGLSLRCVVDQKKRSAPAERSCWFIALKSDEIDAAASARAGAGASVDTLDFLALLMSGAATSIHPLPPGEGRSLESRLLAVPGTARPAEAGTPTAIGPRPHPDSRTDPSPPSQGGVRGGRAQLPTSSPRDQSVPVPAFRQVAQALNEILASASLPAATLAFRYWLHAISHGLPEPAPRHVNLAGADLEDWTIRGRSPDQPLRLRGANLEGARLNRARLENVDLTGANFKHVEAREALFLNVAAADADLTRSDLCDLKWRVGSLAEARLPEARISGTHWIDVDLTGAALPENWEHDAASVDRARMEARPIVQP